MDEFHKTANNEFLKLEQKIHDAIIQTFQSIPVTEKGIDLDKEGIRGPSSTWTYLITDNQFGLWVGLLHGSNIGFTATATAAYGPLYVALGLVQRFFRKKED